MHSTYYRSCWHVVSQCLFPRYRQNFFSGKRSLQPTSLHPPRSIAPSGLRPLRKIPHCCLPRESGPCLSPSVADHSLKPATDHRLGEPLPHQLTNQTQAHQKAKNSFNCILYVHNHIRNYPSFPKVIPFLLGDSYVLLTRPPLISTRRYLSVRLACVKHTASVHPEPGSNSQKIQRFIT